MQLLLILLALLAGPAVFAWGHRQRFRPLLRQVWHSIRWFWLALLVLNVLGRAALPLLAKAAGAPGAAGEGPPWQLVAIEIAWGVVLYAGVALPFLASIVLARRRSSLSLPPDTDRFMSRLRDSLIGAALLSIIVMLSIHIGLVAGSLIGALLSGAASEVGALLSGSASEIGLGTFNTLVGIIGGMLGAFGEVIGAEIAAVWRRRRQEGGAAAHAWVWVFRIAFFAIGAVILVLWLISDYFGPNGPIQAGLFIILSLLVGGVTRRSIGWSLLTCTAVCAALIPSGVGIVMLSGGQDQDTPLAGIGFMIAFLGFIGFYASAITALLVGLRALVHDWRDRHGHTPAPPPTGAR